MKEFSRFVEEKINTQKALWATGIDSEVISKWKENVAQVINISDFLRK